VFDEHFSTGMIDDLYIIGQLHNDIYSKFLTIVVNKVFTDNTQVLYFIHHKATDRGH